MLSSFCEFVDAQVRIVDRLNALMRPPSSSHQFIFVLDFCLLSLFWDRINRPFFARFLFSAALFLIPHNIKVI